MSEHLLRLSKADDEDERDMIYDGIYEVAEVCSYLSADMVSRYNNHERLTWLLAQIIQDLPANIDWLDPDIEREARALLAALETEKGGDL